MRWLLLFVACSTLGAADLASVGPVYFWPMSAALDQYIAERAAAEGLFKITIDPADAKSVMTDHVDSRFFEGMQEIFKEDEPPAPDQKADEAKGEKKEEPAEGSVEAGLEPRRPANRPQGSPKGTVFLVDVKSRQVVWSTYLGDFERRSEKLHKEARHVVERMRKTMTPSAQ